MLEVISLSNIRPLYLDYFDGLTSSYEYFIPRVLNHGGISIIPPWLNHGNDITFNKIFISLYVIKRSICNVSKVKFQFFFYALLLFGIKDCDPDFYHKLNIFVSRSSSDCFSQTGPDKPT